MRSRHFDCKVFIAIRSLTHIVRLLKATIPNALHEGLLPSFLIFAFGEFEIMLCVRLAINVLERRGTVTLALVSVVESDSCELRTTEQKSVNLT